LLAGRLQRLLTETTPSYPDILSTVVPLLMSRPPLRLAVSLPGKLLPLAISCLGGKNALPSEHHANLERFSASVFRNLETGGTFSSSEDLVSFFKTLI
jgi:hypothetical protein